MARETRKTDRTPVPDDVGLDPYADALAAFLRRPLEPNGPTLTVSIEGDWGSGKTTFAERVAERLRKPSEDCKQGTPVVMFRPWAHDKTEDLWSALVSTFNRDMRHHLRRRDALARLIKLWFGRICFWGDAHKRRPRVVVPGMIAFAILIAAIWSIRYAAIAHPLGLKLALGLLGGALDARFEAALGLLSAPAGFAVATIAVLATAARVVPPLIHHLRARGTSEPPPLITRLQHHFAEYVDALCPRPNTDDPAADNPHRAVIIVDDLDRCTAAGVGVSETLRALGALISEKANVTIVLAIDRDRVASALAAEGELIAKYLPDATGNDERDNAVREGHRFLEKFIHVTFRVPSFDVHATSALIAGTNHGDRHGEGEDPKHRDESRARALQRARESSRSALCSHAESVRSILGHNPRRLLIWRNEVYLRLLTLETLGRVGPDRSTERGRASIEQVARVEALLMAWPRFARDLRAHPDLLKWLTAFAIADPWDWPARWGIKPIKEGRLGARELKRWLARLDDDDHARELLRGDATATEGEVPPLIAFDTRLILEIQRPLPPEVSRRTGPTPSPKTAKPLEPRADVAPPTVEAKPGAAGPDPESAHVESPVLTGAGAEPPPTTPPDDKSPTPSGTSSEHPSDHAREPRSGARDPDSMESERPAPPRKMTTRDAATGRFYDAELRAAERDVSSAIERHGDSSSAHARALDRMQQVLWSLGRFREAVEANERAIAIGEAGSGIDQPIQATRYTNLAVVLHDLGDLAEARRLLERAIEMQEKHFDPDHPGLAISYSNLAIV
ncbi:MAG: P-loop NTPase fold protein, partial [Planctomycetota bacterium]